MHFVDRCRRTCVRAPHAPPPQDSVDPGGEAVGTSSELATTGGGDTSARAAQGAQTLRAWLQRLDVELDPTRLGIVDAAQRVQAALGSVRGRNFIGAVGAGGL